MRDSSEQTQRVWRGLDLEPLWLAHHTACLDFTVTTLKGSTGEKAKVSVSLVNKSCLYDVAATSYIK